MKREDKNGIKREQERTKTQHTETKKRHKNTSFNKNGGFFDKDFRKNHKYDWVLSIKNGKNTGYFDEAYQKADIKRPEDKNGAQKEFK